ncbi:3-oxoacyl-ACP reductase [Mycobacteroides sp. H001]|uniref:SDR family oxidoreductase n=1 Tax=unclassified Mycobacteroides TaxID=2618759 RepID=UPI0007141BBD|nr:MULTISPECIES: SDR family oxidoreductase [unclassified Mycobacteroides]KRQ20395.1 3-oxoacyl-ACP reductase [Mycobacteroides sp. H072]KRQ34260.1 3-oxoacyl-ACP reductase [Mycobacteroides sp. H002]KRQ52023.1 3-oxoacyl-ACP reductase [Mycobacteroides sp. H054]KRQ71295.1 3-oxoacyl-ACP reductase [Mycobacteroides sp. H001]
MSSVLITGASRGIGRAVASEFARRGHRVVATARDPRSLDDLRVDQRLALDVTDDASVRAAVDAAGEIDIVISNAGVIFFAAVEAIPLGEFEQLLRQNTVGALRVAQAVLPQMRQRGQGRLLFMSSIVGRIVLPPGAAYAATKWALEALVEALAIEVAPFGIEAAMFEPGAVSSGALDDVQAYTLPQDPYSALLTGGGDARDRQITPEEVANEVVDAAENSHLPLRIPIGDPARQLLQARRDAPDDVPFVPGSTPKSNR